MWEFGELLTTTVRYHGCRLCVLTGMLVLFGRFFAQAMLEDLKCFGLSKGDGSISGEVIIERI